MKYNFILDVLDSVSDEHILDCAPPLKVKNKYSFVAKLGIACACLAVITASAWLVPKAMKEPPTVPPVHTESSVTSQEHSSTSDTEIHTETSTQGENTEPTLPTTDTSESSQPKPEDPVYVDGLQVIKAKFSVSGGAGFEGHLVKDISDLNNGNPWNPSRPIVSLPVYKNLAYNPDPHGGPTVYLSREKMLEIAKEAAEKIGESVLDYTEISYIDQKMTDTTDVPNAENPVCLWAYTEGTWILVSATGSCSYRFTDTRNVGFYENLSPTFVFEYIDNNGGLKNRITLPDGVKLGDDPSNEDIINVFRYVFDNHSRFVTSHSYELVNKTTTYTFQGTKSNTSSSHSVYETFPDDYVRTLMSYYFGRASITVSDAGDTVDVIIPFNNSLKLTSEKLGDYPIITDENALNLLLRGKYISSVPTAELKNGEINVSDVHRCELIYRTDEYVIPYYKFYVELNYDSEAALSNGWDPTLKLYGVFYVPAVEGKYLSE